MFVHYGSSNNSIHNHELLLIRYILAKNLFHTSTYVIATAAPVRSTVLMAISAGLRVFKAMTANIPIKGAKLRYLLFLYWRRI